MFNIWFGLYTFVFVYQLIQKRYIWRLLTDTEIIDSIKPYTFYVFPIDRNIC